MTAQVRVGSQKASTPREAWERYGMKNTMMMMMMNSAFISRYKQTILC